jgi:hypothetical protein
VQCVGGITRVEDHFPPPEAAPAGGREHSADVCFGHTGE